MSDDRHVNHDDGHVSVPLGGENGPRHLSQRESASATESAGPTILDATTAIEHVDEAVVVTDADGTIVYVNPSFETMTGYSRDDALGKNPRFLKSGAQDAALYATMWATISGGQSWRGRLLNKKKDGSLYSADATISPVRNAAGVTTSYVNVSRDVTATLALEAQFLHSQKMEAVGRLAGGVAHDFNNVLSVILSYAELISGDLEPDAPLRADIEEIRTAALRAAALTTQLLAFSRQQVLAPKVLNLNESVVGLEKMLHRLLGADVKLTILTASSLWNVKADPGQVEQILMNLAVNARDAMPQGGGLTIKTANVEVDHDGRTPARGAIHSGTYVEIAVIDTGTGMDGETQARIFDPFFTTKAKGKGTGLGLATVFGIVEQSGGHIQVHSAPSEGTTFRIYFPKVSETSEMGPSLSPPAIEGNRGGETVLIVEDDEQVRAVARHILQRQGYAVLEAPNGGEALLICEQHGSKIDLLISDLVLPRMSGQRVAERLTAMRPDMKVLFISGYTDDEVVKRGVLDTNVAYLQKPFTPTSLSRKVREALGGTTGAGDGSE